MKYEDLMDIDLKEYQVPMLLSKKLFQLSEQIGEDKDWDKILLECAQHAYNLEDLISKLSAKKEKNNASP